MRFIGDSEKQLEGEPNKQPGSAYSQNEIHFATYKPLHPLANNADSNKFSCYHRHSQRLKLTSKIYYKELLSKFRSRMNFKENYLICEFKFWHEDCFTSKPKRFKK